METCGQLLKQATQSDGGFEDPRELNCDQIFLQTASGKNKKKKIYDTGFLSQLKFSDVGSSSTVSSGLNENPIMQEMTEKINSQPTVLFDLNEVIQEMTEKINSQAEELNEMRRQMSEMRALIEQLTASTRGMFPSSSHPQLTHQLDSND